jgi:GT2 family glycosyltransferase
VSDGTTFGFGIPFFSGLDYLRDALASLVAQHDENWTAVVVDDCSPEPGAAEVVAEMRDPRIRYVRNHANLGLAANFERCLSVTGVDIVAIFHADDVLEPDYVGTIRAAHSDAPHAAIVAPMATIIGADGAPSDTLADKVKRRQWPSPQRYELTGDEGLARLMSGFFVYCPAMSYRLALLPRPAFDRRWGQLMDVDLSARVLLDGGTILLDRTPVYRYRRHAGTMTSHNTKAFTRLAEETDLAYELMETARAQGWKRTARAARLHWTQRVNGAITLAGSIRHPVPARRAAVRDIISLR